MATLARPLVTLMATCSLGACSGSSDPASGPAPAPGLGRIRLDGLPSQLAVGDSVPLSVTYMSCFADFCAPAPVPGPLSWTTTPPGLAGIGEQGRLVTLGTGRVTVRVEVGDTSLSATTMIIPRTAMIAWRPDAIVAQVGDLVELRAVALDAMGREVGTVRQWMYSRGGVLAPTGAAADERRVFRAVEPGALTIRAWLGDRVAEIQVIVLP